MSTDFFNQLTSVLIPAIEHFRSGGYWVAFFAAFLETLLGIGLLLPGSTLLILLGILAAKGYLDLGDVIWFAVLGAIVGDNLNYSLGKHFGQQWLKKDYWFLKASHLEKSRRFLDRHGAKSVFLGRFVPTVKELMPFIAGSVHMNQAKFMLWNVLGAIGWGFQFVLPGYFFAQSMSLAQMWLSRIGMLIVLTIVFIGLFYWIKHLLVTRGPMLISVAASLGRSVIAAVLGNVHVKTWCSHHPHVADFIKTRINPGRFSGLPLSLLVLGLLYTAGLFGGLVEDVIDSNLIVAVDVRLAHLLMAYRSEWLTSFFTWVTLLGKSPIIGVFSVCTLFIFWLNRQRTLIMPFLISVLGSTGLSFLGKLAFHRARPETAIYLEQSASFPSGHATVAIAFYGFIAYVMMRNRSNWSSKVNIFLLTCLLIFAIGFSRLYLGEHYLSDVLGGYLVGTMWLIFSVILIGLGLKAPGPPESVATPSANQYLLRRTAVVMAMLFYIGFAGLYSQPKAPKVVSTPSVLTNPTDVISKPSLRHTLTMLGTKQEPINLIFVANSTNRLLANLQKTGWRLMKNSTEIPFSKQLTQILTGHGRGALPLSPSFWNNKVQNWSLVLQQATTSYAHSTHLKIWATGAQLPTGEQLFIGLTNRVSGLSWKLFPKISPDIDYSRQQVITLLKNNTQDKVNCVRGGHPESGRNFLGDPFYTDGKLCIIRVHE